MPDDHKLASPAPLPLIAARPKAPLGGKVAVPGDKSISHRALMFGALAVGRTEISGLLEGEDVLATAAALRPLGAGIERPPDRRCPVAGARRAAIMPNAWSDMPARASRSSRRRAVVAG